MTGTATATAHSNIALIKYWGKRDAELSIPSTSSLSLTLDAYRTTTAVRFDGGLDRDELSIDGSPVDGVALRRVERFLGFVRDLAGTESRAVVTSTNDVPTGAGLASSASGFAALAGAATAAAGLDLDPTALSRLARRGSGSASRSVFGGLVVWNAGTDDQSSYAEPVDAPGLDLALVVVVVSGASKAVSSSDGMRRTVETSPFYEPWVTRSATDLDDMRAAIAGADMRAIAAVAERNALGMHATMLGADPPFSYWAPASVQAMDAVRRLRAEGADCGFTMDAGPNVKVVCRSRDVGDILARLRELLPGVELVAAGSGPGIAVSPGAA